MSRTGRWILIGGIVVVLLLVVGYFGMGWFVYQQLADVRGSCDKHLANNPSGFTNISNWEGDPEFSTVRKSARAKARGSSGLLP